MKPPEPHASRSPDSREDAPNVRVLARGFDPTSPEAEDQYDAVVRRINRVRARRRRLARELERLSLPFVEGEPRVLSGPRRGQPLSPGGRRRRLARLIDVGVALRDAEAEERFASADLDRMNRELERWARETWET